MRYKFSEKSLEILFSSLRECGYETNQLAYILGKHPRTIRDWRRGKFSIDEASVEKFLKLSGLDLTRLTFTKVDEVTRKRLAGIQGGKARMKKHGNFGTIEDKRRGGINSFLSQKDSSKTIFTRSVIRKPTENNKLAEFIGICMGDGSITEYQLSISLNTLDDSDFIEYVAKLGELLFGLKATVNMRKSKRCTTVVFNGVNLVDFLISKGLPKGDKIRAGLDIPQWIRCERELSKTCIRGLFDTDGSIFLETHRINGKTYSYPRMMLVSASEPLRESVCDILNTLEIRAIIRMNRSVSIERFTDIEKYFRIIGSSNQKHLDRFAKFGGVG